MQNSLTHFHTDLALAETPSTIPPATPTTVSVQTLFCQVRRILLPFDLSRSSVRALRVVAELAANTGATIHLLHGLMPLDSTGRKPEGRSAEEPLEKASERVLKHWVNRLVKSNVKTFVTIRTGDPVDAILLSAASTAADLIVMTSRSFSRHPSEFKRSTAEKVSRQAACPVLTIPEKCIDHNAYTNALTSRWDKILVPVDFSAVAGNALLYAGQIAKETGATLLLAHGCKGRQEDEFGLRLRLKTWARQMLGHPVSFRVVIWAGGPSLYAILTEAMISECNLIVLPTTGELWARRLRAGSITDGVLRQAPCPVITINEKVCVPQTIGK